MTRCLVAIIAARVLRRVVVAQHVAAVAWVQPKTAVEPDVKLPVMTDVMMAVKIRLSLHLALIVARIVVMNVKTPLNHQIVLVLEGVLIVALAHVSLFVLILVMLVVRHIADNFVLILAKAVASKLVCPDVKILFGFNKV